ncbi:uncharacterized protein PADG_02926 [Paracoccidioides brasiliensis Pb18]|uniref:Methyltransferase domain-containing protein n=1 Tax=Paracoccidioides brasiliensis (strain Pb18) TaxID=502780 RepID=C1G6X1_PARBD|nr:uncharacterized protein PADG_02926 [Paracoccidioides brasiliensis Pb18]EEH46828.2 hypothetical protein PADG_02926 [Paracoccidioides brasiliensis Pb18]
MAVKLPSRPRTAGEILPSTDHSHVVETEKDEEEDEEEEEEEAEAGSTSDYHSELGEEDLIPLTPSVTDYLHGLHKLIKQHGRTYHAFCEGKYHLPNDELEKDRMDMVHRIYELALGELFLAPISDNPRDILDMGTGTGIWAIECADNYPSALVRGNDLSPIQPFFVPSNCVFEIDDFEEWGLPYEFDFMSSPSTPLLARTHPHSPSRRATITLEAAATRRLDMRLGTLYSGLSKAERTGSPIFHYVSYVIGSNRMRISRRQGLP